MTNVSGSATSLIEGAQRTLATHASLRFLGDGLEPFWITDTLEVTPSLSYRKGDVYARAGEKQARGRTNLWLLSTKGIVRSLDLADHLQHLVDLLYSSEQRIEGLRQILRRRDVEADLTCFWYGEKGAKYPVIPDHVKAAIDNLPAKLELDFDTD